ELHFRWFRHGVDSCCLVSCARPSSSGLPPLAFTVRSARPCPPPSGRNLIGTPSPGRPSVWRGRTASTIPNPDRLTLPGGADPCYDQKGSLKEPPTLPVQNPGCVPAHTRQREPAAPRRTLAAGCRGRGIGVANGPPTPRWFRGASPAGPTALPDSIARPPGS